jgi:hypothetical protein
VISFLIYSGLKGVDPPRGLGEVDNVDNFGTFTSAEAKKTRLGKSSDIEGIEVVVERNKVDTNVRWGCVNV